MDAFTIICLTLLVTPITGIIYHVRQNRIDRQRDNAAYDAEVRRCRYGR
jgi:hypothetical protein